MSTGMLPDELVKEILASLILVPDSKFFSMDHVSPFSPLAEPALGILANGRFELPGNKPAQTLIDTLSTCIRES